MICQRVSAALNGYCDLEALRGLSEGVPDARVRYLPRVLNRLSSHSRAGNGNSFAQAINLLDKASEVEIIW